MISKLLCVAVFTDERIFEGIRCSLSQHGLSQFGCSSTRGDTCSHTFFLRKRHTQRRGATPFSICVQSHAPSQSTHVQSYNYTASHIPRRRGSARLYRGRGARCSFVPGQKYIFWDSGTHYQFPGQFRDGLAAMHQHQRVWQDDAAEIQHCLWLVGLQIS